MSNLNEVFLKRLISRHGSDLVPITSNILNLINGNEIQIGRYHVHLIGTLKSDSNTPVAIRISSKKKLKKGEVGIALSFLALHDNDETTEDDMHPSLHIVKQAQDSESSFKYAFTHLDISRSDARSHPFFGEVKARLEKSNLIHLEPGEYNDQNFRTIRTRLELTMHG